MSSIRQSLEKYQEDIIHKAVPIRISSKPILEHQPKASINPFKFVLAGGLSIMLLLGFSEYMGIDIQNPTSSPFFLIVLACTGAISINIAQYLAVYAAAKQSFRFRMDQHRKAFWILFLKGCAACWLSAAIVILEIAFAAPGLLGLLSPSLSRNAVYRITVFCAVGLSALVNVSMAWGDSIKSVKQEKEIQRVKEEYRLAYKEWQEESINKQEEKENSEEWKVYCKKYQEKQEEFYQVRAQESQTQTQLQEIDLQIRNLEKSIEEAKQELKIGWQSWYVKVESWLYVNPELISADSRKDTFSYDPEPNSQIASIKHKIEDLSQQIAALNLITTPLNGKASAIEDSSNIEEIS